MWKVESILDKEMGEKTTIKVNENTLKVLKKLKEENDFSSMDETVMLLRNYSLFLITSKYRFDKLCLCSITEVVFIDDPPN